MQPAECACSDVAVCVTPAALLFGVSNSCLNFSYCVCLRARAACAVHCSGQVVAFKALLSSTPRAASVEVEAKGLASGAYTVWRDVGDGIGTTQTTVASATTIQDCLLACDRDDVCAAVAMVAADAANTASPNLSSCRLIFGYRQVGSTMRTVTRVDINRLANANVTDTLALSG